MPDDIRTNASPAGALLDHDESRLWLRFTAADTTDSFCRSWLALQCNSVTDTQVAVLLLQQEGRFAPVAIWPDASQGINHLRAVAEEALRTGAAVVRPPPHDDGATGLHVAWPVVSGSAGLEEAGPQAVEAVVVLDLLPRVETEVERALRALHWGAGWLETLLLGRRLQTEQDRIARTAGALDLVAVAGEHERLEAACTALANELARRLEADRVSIGMRGGRRVRLLAMSHTAWFRRKGKLVDGLEHMFEEAVDQEATVAWPPPPGSASRIDVAHRGFAEDWSLRHVVTFVPAEKGLPVGAITLERRDDRPFSPEDLMLGEAIAGLLGPVLAAKQRNRRWLAGRLPDAVRYTLTAAIGPRYQAIKLGLAVATIVLVGAAVLHGEFRVSARAVLEGEVQRAAAAPFEGFIAQAPARAGDVVRAGDVLAVLDDKDLRLDRARWTSERDRMNQKLREAMAKHDRATIGQAAAQVRQAEAQLALTEEKLARTRITAPVDGIVVSGDLSQMIGSPVETGKVLFEIAPLDGYRVVLKVDERDIFLVQTGQHGVLALSGMAGTTRGFDVTRVTPVAEADNGRNTFRAEARLDGSQAGLRPGMEGVGKIVVGERSYLAIWSRGLVEWLRMQAWTWLP